MPSSRSQSPDVPTLDEPQSPPIVAAADLDWNPAAEPGGDHGAKLIQKVVRRLPSGPGVYRMFDANGEVLYVGKARNLKNRVTNYARTGGHSNRIARMIQQTASMEFVTTHTETEALLLEANLIKRMRPRFNVLMRDDKSFPYIFLKEDHRAPGIFKHRGAHSRKGDYFGPFASAGAVTNTINALQRAFLLRTCADSYYDNRTRPCLLYQIKRCSAPCTGEIGPDEYRLLVEQAKDFLTGKSQAIKAEIAKAMEVASVNMEFERAAMFRDRLTALSHVQGHQDINPQNLDEADIFAIHTDGGLACIQVFFFRTGQNWGNRSYFPRADPTLSASEILGAFLSQFYDDKPVPKEILLSHAVDDQAILQEALCLRAGRRVGLTVPQRGEKKQLTDHVLTNVRQAHGRKLAETASQARLLAGFAETFGLARAPRRIEVYDNSHIMGSQAVGAMIVAGPEGFAKNHYRKFNIRSEHAAPGDDLAMMREMIERRFARLIKEEGIPEETGLQEQSDVLPAWPDVILIDGGQGQMSAVREALAGLGLHDTVTAIGVAKGQDRDAGRERFFMDGRQPFSLPPRDPVLYFTQRLRDESHRFAIGSHRARRKRELVRNPLDEIGGIGPARKRALLHSFGTAKAVARASIADLVKVEGISEAMARLVHEHFNQNAES